MKTSSVQEASSLQEPDSRVLFASIEASDADDGTGWDL